jgi:hypothetical protein
MIAKALAGVVGFVGAGAAITAVFCLITVPFSIALGLGVMVFRWMVP